MNEFNEYVEKLHKKFVQVRKTQRASPVEEHQVRESDIVREEKREREKGSDREKDSCSLSS